MTELKPGVPFEEYKTLPGVSTTRIKAMAPTPQHYWDKYLNPDRPQEKADPSMAVSNAARLLVHRPDDWENTYATLPDGLDRRTKEGKETFAKIEARGVTPLKKEESDRAQAMAEAVCGIGIAQVLFNNRDGIHNGVIAWEDGDTGLTCKVLLDFHLPPCEQFASGVIWATKTAGDISNEGFRKQAYNAGYHTTAAMQIEAFMQHYQLQEPPLFIWGAATTSRPHMARPFYMTPEQHEEGLIEYRRLINLLNECTTNNEWPGYDDELTPLGLPPFAKKQRETNRYE